MAVIKSCDKNRVNLKNLRHQKWKKITGKYPHKSVIVTLVRKWSETFLSESGNCGR